MQDKNKDKDKILICPICFCEDFTTVDVPKGYTEKYQTTGVISDCERFVVTSYKTMKTCNNCKLELTFNKSDREVETAKSGFNIGAINTNCWNSLRDAGYAG